MNNSVIIELKSNRVKNSIYYNSPNPYKKGYFKGDEDSKEWVPNNYHNRFFLEKRFFESVLNLEAIIERLARLGSNVTESDKMDFDCALYEYQSLKAKVDGRA